MRFDFFQTRSDAHLRKAKEYLQQANLARIEHQIAADHHAALAAMYAQRVTWLEEEISGAQVEHHPAPRGIPSKPVNRPSLGLQSVLSWPRAARLEPAQVSESA